VLPTGKDTLFIAILLVFGQADYPTYRFLYPELFPLQNDMKLPTIGITTLLLAVAGAEVGTPEMRTRAVPIRVPLTPPLDWDVKEEFAKKKQLGKTIKAPLKEFLGEGWGKYIACQCQDWGSGCAYTLSLQGMLMPAALTQTLLQYNGAHYLPGLD